MVKALIEINDKTNRVINIVKAKYGLKDKSEAITIIVNEYESNIEPQLKPEYKEKLNKIKGKHFSRKDFEKKYLNI